MLTGYKTYIFATLGGLTVVCHLLGWFSADVTNTLLGLFGFGGLAALRAAVTQP